MEHVGQSLQKLNLGPREIEKPSSTHLLLIRMLDRCGQIFSREIQTDEARFWLKALEKLSETEIEICFTLYLQGAQYFPKPVDILEIAEHRAENKQIDKDYKRVSQQEWELAQASQKEYFASDEYKEAAKRIVAR